MALKLKRFDATKYIETPEDEAEILSMNDTPLGETMKNKTNGLISRRTLLKALDRHPNLVMMRYEIRDLIMKQPTDEGWR